MTKNKTETKIKRHLRLFLQYKNQGKLYVEQAQSHARRFWREVALMLY